MSQAIASSKPPPYAPPLIAQITGTGSAVIRDLPCRSYVVEQVSGWSWRYGDAPQTIEVPEAGASVTFGTAAVRDKWLSGSSEAVRNRKG